VEEYIKQEFENLEQELMALQALLFHILMATGGGIVISAQQLVEANIMGKAISTYTDPATSDWHVSIVDIPNEFKDNNEQ